MSLYSLVTWLRLRRLRNESVAEVAGSNRSSLWHGKGMSKVGGDKVERKVERFAREEGMVVEEGYYTDLSQGKLIENYLKMVNCSIH
ncbi:hypothetical protein CASFOL_031410 [Castilleja foliolosa]|uniref:Uncharacterized protein n=1 Tax=Castilleja foliolosa TaxID=1961234 RepID=A0ABD3C5B3_9LAMI